MHLVSLLYSPTITRVLTSFCRHVAIFNLLIVPNICFLFRGILYVDNNLLDYAIAQHLRLQAAVCRGTENTFTADYDSTCELGVVIECTALALELYMNINMWSSIL